MTLIAVTALAILAGAIALGIGSDGPNAAPARRVARPRAGVTTSTTPAWAADQAFGAALFFLDHYELPSGRVVRWDQGADTVSEGEAYAMLLSVAAGDGSRFDAAWDWTRTHLLQPSGLLAWHWAHGAVTSTEPASDADVDAAYALELAATRFHQPADLSAATSMAAAIYGEETAPGPQGPMLLAGPWAVGPPAFVNPSYASPSELAALAQLPGQAQNFSALAAGTRALVGEVLGSSALPPDWVQLASGAPADVTPQGSTNDDKYGFDAVRLPIRWGASCTVADRRAVAGLWPVLASQVRRGRGTLGAGLHRGPGQWHNAISAPVGLVAAAASASAAGHHDQALGLLDRAEALNRAHPSYYSSAWVALGRMFLETARLGTCPAA